MDSGHNTRASLSYGQRLSMPETQKGPHVKMCDPFYSRVLCFLAGKKA